MPSNSILEAIKIQSKVVIPIVKALERELGKERAHAIVGDAIAQSYVEYRQRHGFTPDVHPGVEVDGPEFPVEQRVVVNSESEYGHDIERCAFADFFRKIDEPEIGALMTCGVDFAAEELMRPGWEFSRSRTLMQGADGCDFRWKRPAQPG